MSKKTIEINDTKAIRVQAVEIRGQHYVSLRQLYRKKGQKEWLPAKQGISIPLDSAEAVAKFIKKYATDESTSWDQIEVGRKGEE